MRQPKLVIQAVDAFMAADKLIVSGSDPPEWQLARDEGAMRVKLPLEIEGEQEGFLVADAFPDHHKLKFMVGLSLTGPLVDRLDFDLDDAHSNGWAPRLPALVKGPHWHRWQLNRETFQFINKKLKLPHAEVFKDARTFDAVFRHFCAENRIQLGALNLDFPPRRGLL